MDNPFINQLQAENLERNFPIFLSMMHAGCDVFEVRQAITDNLYDEEHGEKNHTELWLRFGETIGTTRELKKHYGISDDCSTEFFRQHEMLDVKHANSWWNIIETHANTPERQLAVMKAVQQGRDALWGFLDGICHAYLPEKKEQIRC